LRCWKKSCWSKEWTGDAPHDSEKRYRRLFESAKDGILILDADTGKGDDTLQERVLEIPLSLGEMVLVVYEGPGRQSAGFGERNLSDAVQSIIQTRSVQP